MNEFNSEYKTELEAIRDLSLDAALPNAVDGTPYLVLPEGHEVKPLDKFLSVPSRHTGEVEITSAESFIAYFKKYNEYGAIYGNIEQAGFKAIFNEHTKESAGWRDFSANYRCNLSQEWLLWIKGNGIAKNQTAFAKFVEDNLLDIHSPSGAEMLEISRSLEAKKSVNFASAIRLENGQNQFTYEEVINGTAGKGTLQIPETFKIAIPVLERGAVYGIEARLRYRIAGGGQLSMWYDLIRPQKIYEAAIQDVWSLIEKETGQVIFNAKVF